jgi:C2 domain
VTHRLLISLFFFPVFSGQYSVQHRVKPGPDPLRPQETTWLPLSKIADEVMKPSHSWVESGTGSLGKMYVEILKCDDLPNMDSAMRTMGGVETGCTDAFCCIIFEDSIVNTDVIRDDLNPRCKSNAQITPGNEGHSKLHSKHV